MEQSELSMTIPEELQGKPINWVVELGPEVVGTANGMVQGGACAFYLKQTGSGDVQGFYSLDGSNYQDIPQNQIFQVDQNIVQWRLTVPASATVQFLIGIAYL